MRSWVINQSLLLPAVPAGRTRCISRRRLPSKPHHHWWVLFFELPQCSVYMSAARSCVVCEGDDDTFPE